MTTVICMGDSISEGVASSNSRVYSYEAGMSRILGSEYKVYNFGRNGATLMPPPDGKLDSYPTLDHFARAVKTAKEAVQAGDKLVITVMLGTNDADIIDYGFEGRGEEYYSKYHDLFHATMDVIIDTFVEICPEVGIVFATSPYSYDEIKHTGFGNLDSVWKFQSELYDKYKSRGLRIVLNDMASHTAPEIMGEDVDAYYHDRLHPNDVGYMYFAHYFSEAVKKLETI